MQKAILDVNVCIATERARTLKARSVVDIRDQRIHDLEGIVRIYEAEHPVGWLQRKIEEKEELKQEGDAQWVKDSAAIEDAHVFSDDEVA